MTAPRPNASGVDAVSHAATSTAKVEITAAARVVGERLAVAMRGADANTSRPTAAQSVAVAASHIRPVVPTVPSSRRARPFVKRAGTDDRPRARAYRGVVGAGEPGAEGMAVSGLRRRAGFIAILLASASVLAGCGVATAGGGTKAGGESLPVTLHLGTAESGEPPYRLFVEQFARDVFDRSDGGIRIIVDWESIPWTPSSEGQLADAVAAGDIDLALIPDRVFPRYGPSALDALHTPFLIDSMALADAVASGEIGAAMLADLPLKGTVGLALAPEELRHPAGYQRALTSAEDFVGLRIRAADVDTQLSTLLTSLGALPRTVVSTRDAAQDGVIDAAETGYPLYRDMPIGMTYTANVTFFPKVNVLLASSGRFESLSAGAAGDPSNGSGSGAGQCGRAAADGARRADGGLHVGPRWRPRAGRSARSTRAARGARHRGIAPERAGRRDDGCDRGCQSSHPSDARRAAGDLRPRNGRLRASWRRLSGSTDQRSGRPAAITVPAPGVASTASRPPSAATRSAIPVIPVPASTSTAPLPSSATVSAT